MKEFLSWSVVKKAWINHERKIEAVVKEPNKFKATLFSEFKGNENKINEFYPFKISLENIFLNVIKDDENDK